MDNNMLRRALWVFLKPLIRLITNLVNPDIGEEVLIELNKFNRKETCWPAPTEKTKIWLYKLRHQTRKIKLGASDGKVKRSILEKFFSIAVDSTLFFWRSKPTDPCVVTTYGIEGKGKFRDFLGSMAPILNLFVFQWSQVVLFSINNPQYFYDVGLGTGAFFLITEGGEQVQGDLRNLSVVLVEPTVGTEIRMKLYPFLADNIWDAVRLRYRFMIPN